MQRLIAFSKLCIQPTDTHMSRYAHVHGAKPRTSRASHPHKCARTWKIHMFGGAENPRRRGENGRRTFYNKQITKKFCCVLWCAQNRSNRGGGPLAQGRAGVHMHTLELSYRETLGHMTTRTETISKKRKWAEQKGGGWYVTREQQPAASCLRKKSKLQSSES